jgi:DNA-binding NarL/FixJ family response regulator
MELNCSAKVYLYSDQPLPAKRLEAVLMAKGWPPFDRFFCDLPDLLVRLQVMAPGILLLDVMPHITLSTLSEFRRMAPECKLVLWVDSISTELAFQAIELGVRGILRKTLPVESQVACLRKVHQGGLWCEKELAQSILAAQRVVLSRREGQLITLITQGYRNKEIASRLCIREGTVQVYVSRLFHKVGARNRLELALIGLTNLTGEQQQLHGETPGYPTPATVLTLRALLREVTEDQPGIPSPDDERP